MGMKFLLLVVVLALAVGWMFTRSRRGRQVPPPKPQAPVRPAQGDAPAAATAMVVCAHCQVHLPQDEARFDVAGKPYCSAEHLVAGPL
jgi:uncharacterized protein